MGWKNLALDKYIKNKILIIEDDISIRKSLKNKLLKVIKLSNLSNAKSVEISMESGVYNYLVKVNWKLEDVMKKIKENL